MITNAAKKLSIAVLTALAFNGSAQNNDWVDLMYEPDANFFEIRDAFYDEWEGKDYKKGWGWKQFHRWEYFWESRIMPDGSFPDYRVKYNEWKDFMRTQPGGINRGGGSLGNWVPLGPFSHQNTQSWSPGQGRLNFIKEDPNDPNTIYAGAPAGGLWKSTDDGATWAPMSDELSFIGISGIAIDPTNSNIIYIATGDADGGDVPSIGIMKSTDGGVTWASAGNVPGMTRDIIINPQNTNILYACSSSGFYKSTDGGNSWNTILTTSIRDIEMKPNDPNTVYATTATTFYYTNDGAATMNLATGLPNQSGRLAIGVTPADPSIVYVLSADQNDEYQEVLKSTNSGVSFTTVHSNGPGPNDLFDGSGQAWYDMAIGVSDTDPDILVVGVLNIHRSTDGGVNWNQINNWSSPGQSSYTHADIHSLKYWNGRLYCGSDGGIYRSSDDGDNFTDLTEGIQIGQFYTIAGSQSDVNTLAGGLQDNGGYAWTNGTWKVYYGADGMGSAVDPTNSNNIYGMIQYGDLYRTTNGGNNLQGEGSPQTGRWVTPMLHDPNQSGRIIAGYDDLYEWTAGGGWNQLSTFAFPAQIKHLEVYEGNSDVIYASTNQSLYRTNDGGANWTNITNGLSSFVGGGNGISSIEVDPTDPDHLWVSIEGNSAGNKVAVTTDGGANWTNISGNLPNLPCHIVKHEPGSANAIYIGMDVGVYYYDDNLGQWVAYMNNLPNCIVNDLEINTANGVIRAGTYGRGVWESGLYSVPVVTDDAGVFSVQTPVGNLCTGAFAPEVTIRNYGTANLTAVDIYYDIDGGAPSVFNWTGNLAQNQNATVTLPSVTSTGSHTFNCWTADPNGVADGNNANDTTSSTYNAVASGTEIYVSITVDCWPGESTWEIRDDLGALVLEGGPYSGNGGDTFVDTFCIADGCYDFIMLDGYGDGLFGSQYGSCTVDGDFSVTDELGNQLVTMATPDFGFSVTENFCLTPPTLTADFSSQQTTICAGETVDFSDLSAGNVVSWDWTFNGGTPATSTQPTPSIVYNTPGTYDVTLTVGDGTGTDTQTLTAYITVVDVPSISHTIGNITCFGDCDGFLQANVTGGDGNYTYAWSTGSNSQTISNLCPGSYDLTVVDGNGCEATQPATVAQPNDITSNATTTDASCGQADGTASISISGGVSPYTTDWGGADPNALSAGVYDVYVTDDNGCLDTVEITIANIGGPTVSSTTVDVSCAGGTDGTASLNIVGGTSPFVEDWNGADPNALPAGTYDYIVTDDNGCVANGSITINEPTALTSNATSSDELLGNDGSVDLSVSGGTPGYTYDWSNGETTQDIFNLTGGTYTCIITDANGCTDTVTVFVQSQVSIDEEGQLAEIKIYPNPASGEFTIEINDSESEEIMITLIDNRGRLVWEERISHPTSNVIRNVDITERADGVYFLRIMFDDGVMQKKILKH